MALRFPPWSPHALNLFYKDNMIVSEGSIAFLADAADQAAKEVAYSHFHRDNLLACRDTRSRSIRCVDGFRVLPLCNRLLHLYSQLTRRIPVRNLYYPDFGKQFNIFLRGELVAKEIPLPRITPRAKDHTRDDKIELVSRYLQQICMLNEPPDIVHSTVTRFNECYKFEGDIFVLVKKSVPHPKGE